MDTSIPSSPIAAEARRLGWGPEKHAPELMLYLGKKTFLSTLSQMSEDLLLNKPVIVQKENGETEEFAGNSLAGYLQLQGKISQTTASSDVVSNAAQQYLNKQSQVLSSLGG